MPENGEVERKGVIHFGEKWKSEDFNNQRLGATGK